MAVKVILVFLIQNSSQKNIYDYLESCIYFLNLNQWTVTDSQCLFTDGSSYKSFTEDQWNSTDESVK